MRQRLHTFYDFSFICLFYIIYFFGQTFQPRIQAVHMTIRGVEFLWSQWGNPAGFGAALFSALYKECRKITNNKVSCTHTRSV